MDYMIVKWIHVVGSTLLFGTGVGSAFYLLAASLTRDSHAVAVTSRHVVIADWLFTTSTAILQPVTGYMLMRIANFSWELAWLRVSIVLYVVAIACWLPVVWLQMRMRTVSAAAAGARTPLPPAYWRYFRWWFALGVPALFSFLAIFYLMIAKPATLF
ncbi:putative integral membrane protein [Cupriavidus gilardii CR3]|uniref:DUF2269 domain-containing protein n=1 Tax=Cupriavidus gilardii TaxID=82541 RepID=A0A6N1BB22_9BURK|nr:DUF2269 domain-containing protein [Cupriavidus gilardii]ALD93320.1 putative integral membrane protein [Cupriavidus gilardii CR3]QQE08727.1 DUF2269 domain-containing protein [Cupriavidus sp. ISTL7]KAB0599277.1 DUF2269 domain-containing protein [Cupriavidus gilardii]MCT9013257.1 DUF2269 domain-containing protein [Cupriavidus gilardii]MCT9052811.1 DUF2269 domain-containing protein [Cupriavidus gilardii]